MNTAKERWTLLVVLIVAMVELYVPPITWYFTLIGGGLCFAAGFLWNAGGEK